MTDVELDHFVPAVLYLCKRCGVPVASVRLATNATGRTWYQEHSGHHIAVALLSTRNPDRARHAAGQRQRRGAKIPRQYLEQIITCRIDVDDVPPTFSCWCWKCGREFSLKVDEMRRYVRQVAEFDAAERTIHLSA